MYHLQLGYDLHIIMNVCIIELIIHRESFQFVSP